MGSSSFALTGMNVRNQILSIALSSLKAAAETIGFQSNRISPSMADAGPICPAIAKSCSLAVRPDDSTPIELLPVLPMDSVTEHDHVDDCWVILYDIVYDLTNFMREHPGGAEVLLEHAGRDATLAFQSVGHSKQALLSMKKMIVGVLPKEERLYLKPTRSSIWSSFPGFIELQPKAL